MEALKEIQSRFYRDFPPHPQEQVYGFATASTMKPTQWSCKFWAPSYYFDSSLLIENFLIFTIIFSTVDPGGGINQIPGECTISGDVRFVLLHRITHVIC